MTQYWANLPHTAPHHIGGHTSTSVFKRKKSDRDCDKYNFGQVFYQFPFPSEDSAKGAVFHSQIYSVSKC